MAKDTKFPSELRYDLISKDWVVIATGRAKRPHMFKMKRQKVEVAQKDCPFCNIETQRPPTLILVNGKKMPLDKRIPRNWTVIVVPNKFPVFIPSPKLNPQSEGKFYQKINAAGFHEVIVSRHHKKQLAQLSLEQVKEVIDAYQMRYRDLMNLKFVNHIAIFHNHGAEAGASVAHPHSQLITTPLVDSDMEKALEKSRLYYRSRKKCLSCEMNQWEKKSGKRIVFENKKFLVICPFASKSAFEMIISPKQHLSYFERITENEKHYLAEALKTALARLNKGLNDPPYNFYLHTSPCNNKKHDYYHWHWTILPKTSIWAGFEIGTRMEISTLRPEDAAAYLRKQ